MDRKRPFDSDNDDELQASFKRFRGMKRDNARMTRQLVSVNQQLSQLRETQYKLLKRQHELENGYKLQDTINAYSRAAYIEIAQRMQVKLPRELRDIINTQLWDPSLEDHLHPTSNVDDLGRIFRMTCSRRPCQCLKGVTLHPWLDPACVGQATAVESAEMIYRLVVGMYADSPEMITYQLYADPFHVGFVPLPVIDSFTIEINIDYCLRKQRRSREAVENGSKEEAYSMLDTLAEAVENMLKIPKKRGFVLDITLEQRYIRPNVLAEVLKVLKPAVLAFEKEEAEIDMRFVHYNESGTRKPDREKFEWDLSDVYVLRDKEWQREFAAALDETPWILKSHRTYNAGAGCGINPRTDCDKRTWRESWIDVYYTKLEDDEKDPVWTTESLRPGKKIGGRKKRGRPARK